MASAQQNIRPGPVLPLLLLCSKSMSPDYCSGSCWELLCLCLGGFFWLGFIVAGVWWFFVGRRRGRIGVLVIFLFPPLRSSGILHFSV